MIFAFRRAAMRFVIVLLLITPLSAQTNVSPCAPKIQKENALLQTALRDFATASRQLQMRLLEQPKRAKHFDKERMKTVEAYQRVSLQISHLDALHTKDQPE